MKRTLAVLLILAGLGAYVYFVEVKGKQREAASEKKSKRVMPFEIPDVDAVRLENASGKVSLAKHGETWQMTEPVSAPADESAVSSLLSSLAAAEIKATVETAALSEYGLQPPKASVRIGARDKHTTLLIGRKSPVSQDLYVAREGEPGVFLTAGAISANLERKPDEFRDKRLLSFEAEAVTAVSVVEGKFELLLERTGEHWALSKPRRQAADDTLAHGLAADLANLRATAWISEAATPAELAAHGLKNPQARVRAKLTSGNTVELLLGNNVNGERAAMVAGALQIVRIADWSARNLLKKDTDLRDRRLFPLQPQDIAKLEFKTGSAQTFTFSRVVGGWSVADANTSGVAQGEPVDELLTALTDYRATEYQPATPAALKNNKLAPPQRKVTAFDATGKPLASLAFGREEDGWAVWAQTDDTSVMAKASNDFVKNKWPSNPAAFFAPAATAPAPAP